MKIGRPGKAIAAILCLAVAALVWRSIALRPRIESLDPPAAAAGTELRIRGGGFGQGGGESALLVDGAALTAKSIVSWSDTEIVFRMPAIVDSGLVAVRTGAGLSNRELFMNSAKLPVVPERMEAALSGPSIKSIVPAEGEIGTLLRVEGINFGSGGPGSSVIFTSGTPVSPLAFTTADPESVRNAVVMDSGIPGEIETWDDKGISVRIPDGAGSGAVLVRVPAGGKRTGFRPHHRKTRRQAAFRPRVLRRHAARHCLAHQNGRRQRIRPLAPRTARYAFPAEDRRTRLVPEPGCHGVSWCFALPLFRLD